MVTLAINGFGRIGRAAFKIARAHEEVAVAAINDLGDLENLAYLLRYDSVYGRYSMDVEVKDEKLFVGGKEVAVFHESDPVKLPWRDLGIDVVVESTGVFTEEKEARGHLIAGARKVIISAPTESENVPTVILGVNDKDLIGSDIISNASCTTNCATPVMAVLDREFGIKKGMLSTIHAYTATQGLVDGPAKKDSRRGRAGAVNIIPSLTGAARASLRVLPNLEGKFDGVALRIPVPIVSLSDITVLLKKKVEVEEVNNAFVEAVANPLYHGVIAVTSDQVVSSDFIGDPHSAIVDLSMTSVVDNDLVKVMAWYDNEWGYSNRLIEQVITLGSS